MTPLRLQRSRKKGQGYLWPRYGNVILSNDLPIVYVGRPSRWGNPYIPTDKSDLERVVKQFEKDIMSVPYWINSAKKELEGKNLACFCPLDQPCHADILLKIANS